jgi:4-amino-4-deoxy-L-arabinose transferase-like glycosyltransferase
MSTSWHDFLFASLDKSGLMTVDKPPLSLWIQALSVRIFGFHPLSMLAPQALMGVAAVGLAYDVVRRRFGRAGGFVAGLALALTPITVAISRHNNPDALLALCCVAAVWSAVRGLESGRARWLMISAVCIGLGFETKMGVALLVVPGIALGWMWVAPQGRIAAAGQLLGAGAVLVVVGGAWPLLVSLTPAAHRPWISGTSDNSIWSLIFGYNGLGRIDGQAGGPAGGFGGPMFGGSTGVFRLLRSGLGDQAGWLLGSSVVAGGALGVLSRLWRRDPRTGWLLPVGGAFLTTAVVFSFAHGIFHPYYVSLLAPFAAALLGAGAGLVIPRGAGGVAEARTARPLAPPLIGAGAITELVVLGALDGQLAWATPMVIAIAAACAALLVLKLPAIARTVLLGIALAGLLAAPATWAAQTLGHAENGTFPAGGPATTSGGAASAFRGGPRGFPTGPPGGPPPARGPAAGGPLGAGTASVKAAIVYAKAHGGGTIAVASQSSAAQAILSSGANVAGLGGFSGRESSVSVSWLAAEVKAGRLRWVLAEQSSAGVLPGDGRTGSRAALTVVATVCRRVTITSASGGTVTMYDCRGRADAISAAANR